jgi:ATP-dependent metalloprotease
MGGRAAEEIIFGKEDLTSGCSSDLVKATQMAYQYIR